MSSFNVFSANRFTTVDSVSSTPPLFVRIRPRVGGVSQYNPNLILPTAKGHHLKISLNKHYVYGLPTSSTAFALTARNLLPFSTALVSTPKPKPALTFA